MQQDLKEVQAIVGELLQYSCLEEAFADISLEYVDGKATYNDKGDKCRQVLVDFVNDKL